MRAVRFLLILTISFIGHTSTPSMWSPTSLHAAAKLVAHPQNVNMDIRDKVVVFLGVGSGGSNPLHRNIGWGIPTRGWHPFIEKPIMPLIEAGYERLCVHNPQGHTGFPMQFDQYLHAAGEVDIPRIGPAVDTFADAWRPVMATGVEVIAYIGTPGDGTLGGNGDPQQEALWLSDRNAWWERGIRAVAPYVDLGMTIGYDASANRDINTPTAVFAREYFEPNNIRYYNEARPAAGNSHWFDHPVYLEDYIWDRQSPERRASHRGRHAWEYELNGEIVEILETDQRAREALLDGHSISPKYWVVRVGHNNARFRTIDQYLTSLNVDRIPQRINLKGNHPEGKPLNFVITRPPRFGELEILEPHPAATHLHPGRGDKVKYWPYAYFKGTDSFWFKVTDGVRESREAKVTIKVRLAQPPETYRNVRPAANAGNDRTAQPGQAVSLSGGGSDDGVPAVPGRISMEWTKASGPGNVVFSDPADPNSTATFSEPGDYTLQLTVSDGALTKTDDIKVHVPGQSSVGGGGGGSLPEPGTNIIQPGSDGEATLGVNLPQGSYIQIRIYNRSGDLIRTLVQEDYSAGVHYIPWDGRTDQGEPVASGIYIAHIDINGTVTTEKIVVIR